MMHEGKKIEVKKVLVRSMASQHLNESVNNSSMSFIGNLLYNL